MKETEKYASFKKTVGPPHYHYVGGYDPLDKNEYLLAKGVNVEAIKARNKDHTLIEA